MKNRTLFYRPIARLFSSVLLMRLLNLLIRPLLVPININFFYILFERAFKMMNNGVYFIVIALLVAELFTILVYAN